MAKSNNDKPDAFVGGWVIAKCIRCGEITDKPYLCGNCVKHDIDTEKQIEKYPDLYGKIKGIRDLFDVIDNKFSLLEELQKGIDVLVSENMKLKLRNMYVMQYLENLGGIDKELLYESFKILKGEKDKELGI